MRRGYAMLMALAVLALVTLTLTYNLRRMSLVDAALDVRASGYREHHERLGVRDIASVWVTRVARIGADEGRTLGEMALDPGVDFEVVLPEGVLLELWVGDGQARFLANLSLAESSAERDEMVRVLAGLPGDRPDLVRMGGPAAVSARGMDDALIGAIAGGDSALEGVLREARVAEGGGASTVTQLAQKAGLQTGDLPSTARRLTFEPVLWSVDVRATDLENGAAVGEARWYQVLVEAADSLGAVHEWRTLSEAEFRLSRERAGGG